MFHLDETADVWHSATINLEKDAGHYGKTISELKIDKLAIDLGTWNINNAVPVSFAARLEMPCWLPKPGFIILTLSGLI